MSDDRKRRAEAIQQYRQFVKQKDEIEIQLSNLGSFIRAISRILPDENGSKEEEAIAGMFGPALGLTDAVRMARRSQRGTWMSAPTILGYLKDIGFDFGSYTANPLTAIHTVAKRMVPREVDVNGPGDPVSYRWKGK